MRIANLPIVLVCVLLGSAASVALADGLTSAKVDQPFAPQPGMLDYAAGLDALQAMDLKTADDRLAAAIAAQPKFAPCLLSLGMAHALGDDTDQINQGIGEIEKVLAGDPNNTAIKRLYAFALSRGGRPRITDVYVFSSQDRFDRLLQASCAVPGGGNPFGSQSSGGATPADLDIVVQEYPDDASVDYYDAAALAAAGDLLRARQIASLALRYAPTMAEAYSVRAIAAARMGGLNRAKADAQLARQLDPTDSTHTVALAEKALAACQAALPSESPQQLYQSLMDAARAGQSIEQLQPLADKLVRAANATRLIGDETDQDRLRVLQWAVLTDPKNADNHAKLGQFLLDEADARGEWIDPDKTFSYYRFQTPAMHDQELQSAQSAFKDALAIDSKNIAALVGLSQMAFAVGDDANAEAYAQDAMDIRPNDPQVLDLMSRAMAIEAGNSFLASQAASTTITTERVSPESIWIERQTPTAFGYARAGALSRNADDLLAMAKQYTQEALHNLKDTPESYDYLGTYGFREKRYDIAVKAYALAVKKEPDNIGFQYALANAYAAQGDFADYLAPCTAGRNLEQTSVGAQLLGAWQHIGGSNPDLARPLLDQAVQLDPADSRIAAFDAALAEGKNNTPEALACWRAAIALEQAQLKNQGPLFGSPGSVSYFGTVTRLIGLRLRLGELIQPTDPKSAADLYLQNLAFESSMTPADMLTVAPDGLFPMVDHPWEKARAYQRRSPRGGELMRANCGRAAMALDQSGRPAQAAEYFRHSLQYAASLTLAGAARHDELYDTIDWTTGIDPRLAAQCCAQVGDPTDAQTFTAEANRPQPIETAPPQQPTAGPHIPVRR